MENLKKSFHSVISIYERFVQYESSAGILLLIFTIFALVLSNSPASDFYFRIWEYTFTIGFQNFQLNKPLLLWINDGLMAIFFFVVGLEIKRELLAGELSSFRQAILPIGAAIGGMVIPALLFFILHGKGPGISGWAIPMATDIAFSLGIIKLLGKRVPVSLKVFLTAFAIIDDIGAVLVIALFYTSQLNVILLAISSGIIILLVVFNILNIRNLIIYIFMGIILWVLFLKAGIHPTVASVILAFTIPAKPKVQIKHFLEDLEICKNRFQNFTQHEKKVLLNSDQNNAIEELLISIENVQSPVQKLEHRLHGLVSFFIMPVFAFANAGVVLQPNAIGKLSFDIAISLILGKLLGIMIGTFLFMKLFKASLPEKTGWIHFLGLAFLGGVGFTMSLFINNLAYTDSLLMDQARIGILSGSFISGMIGYLILLLISKK